MCICRRFVLILLLVLVRLPVVRCVLNQSEGLRIVICLFVTFPGVFEQITDFVESIKNRLEVDQKKQSTWEGILASIFHLCW